ncbi:hypothetical protein Oscil6304_5623 [Oscillatoria acuminata PCC 6304]|uniref:Uncharacterized protein n=1 Tax=Oscillatoria acuminata PCC 6304 TaxID=56110 RepID=K9TSE1_9CYAN|nr:hypothetical protein Oscil6304_5623 [Oscillatoria acuminata PCC 6304]
MSPQIPQNIPRHQPGKLTGLAPLPATIAPSFRVLCLKVLSLIDRAFHDRSTALPQAPEIQSAQTR